MALANPHAVLAVSFAMTTTLISVFNASLGTCFLKWVSASPTSHATAIRHVLSVLRTGQLSTVIAKSAPLMETAFNVLSETLNNAAFAKTGSSSTILCALPASPTASSAHLSKGVNFAKTDL